ncbi:hypothetical protein [Wolbachia endosymbiont (group A) of Myopa testacea]|uniref:hypothetical protein n=1 Tax=Wolbachia endosymbiont (group A) of Myopa testacea TaxID=3066148 RepID=UPI003340C6C9
MKTFTGETMRKRTLTVTCRYEPDELADKRLSDVYGQLIERLIKRKKENREKERNESSEFICESIIRKASTEGNNRESNSGVGA